MTCPRSPGSQSVVQLGLNPGRGLAVDSPGKGKVLQQRDRDRQSAGTAHSVPSTRDSVSHSARAFPPASDLHWPEARALSLWPGLPGSCPHSATPQASATPRPCGPGQVSPPLARSLGHLLVFKLLFKSEPHPEHLGQVTGSAPQQGQGVQGRLPGCLVCTVGGQLLRDAAPPPPGLGRPCWPASTMSENVLRRTVCKRRPLGTTQVDRWGYASGTLYSCQNEPQPPRVSRGVVVATQGWGRDLSPWLHSV